MSTNGLLEGTTVPLPTQSDSLHPPRHPEEGSGCFYKVERKTLVWSAPAPTSDQQAVYKMYRQRGLISWQREKVFRFRVQREYDACSYLAEKNLRTTRPLGWFFGEHPDHGRYEVFVTEEISGAQNLLEVVKAKQADDLDFERLFILFREMHRQGFFHGRLDLRNVLGVPGDSDYILMDAPQAMMFKRDLFGSAMAYYDLQQISYYTHDYLGGESAHALLMTYGLTDSEANRIMERVRRGPMSSGYKNFCRFVFGMRSRFE